MLSSARTDTLHYRPFMMGDVEAAARLSAAVGWAHRQEDWRFAAAAGNGYVACSEDAIIGTAFCWTFGDDRATLGMLIVAPERQGCGIGRRLLEHVANVAGNRMTFLYATAAGKPLYESVGFRACGKLTQYRGIPAHIPEKHALEQETLRELADEDMPAVIQMASRACGLDRRDILLSLRALARGVVIEREGEIVGFSLIRPFGLGYAIGPVIAAPSHDDARAKRLIGHWLAQHAGDVVRIDAPETANLDPWLRHLGLTPASHVVRMVRNIAENVQLGELDNNWRYYAVINQALG